VSLLKAFKGTPSQAYLPLPLSTTENGPSIQPLPVLESIIMRHSYPVPQVLIQWDSLDVAAATWEDVDEIKDSFLEFNVEDRVLCNGGSIVMCKKNESVKNVKLEVALHQKITCTGQLKSMRRKRDNGFLLCVWYDSSTFFSVPLSLSLVSVSSLSEIFSVTESHSMIQAEST